MHTIITKYLGPTETRGSRIKATCEAGSVTIPYPHELSGDERHLTAAQALVKKLGWSGTWHAGAWFDGGCVFVKQDGFQFTVSAS